MIGVPLDRGEEELPAEEPSTCAIQRARASCTHATKRIRGFFGSRDRAAFVVADADVSPPVRSAGAAGATGGGPP